MRVREADPCGGCGEMGFLSVESFDTRSDYTVVLRVACMKCGWQGVFQRDLEDHAEAIERVEEMEDLGGPADRQDRGDPRIQRSPSGRELREIAEDDRME